MKFISVQSTKKDSSEYCNIYARVRNNDNNKKYAVGFKIFISEWKKYQDESYIPNSWMESINISYAQFNSILLAIKDLLENDFNPDTAIEDIKRIREQGVFVEPEKIKRKDWKNKYLTFYMQSYIDSLKSGIRTNHKTNEPVSEHYIMSLENTLNIVRAYELEFGRLTLSHIDMEFQDRFMSWCLRQQYSENSIALYLDTIRMIMKYAYAEKQTTSHIFLNPDFVPRTEKTDNVFLSMEQIDCMYNLDLNSPDSVSKIKKIYLQKFNKKEIGKKYMTAILKTINRTRDIFIAGCLTGQRVSDYMRFNKEMIVNVNGKKFLKVKQIKTKKIVYIPLDKRVESIIYKYDGKSHTVCADFFNRYIHIICEVLGWTWIPNLPNVNKAIKAGNRFCDLVCSHTARRSFATNAYLAGIPLQSIMAITGHSKEETLRIYLRLDMKEKALTAAEDMNGFIEQIPQTTEK